MTGGIVKITQFDDAGTLNGTEKIYLVRGTTDYNTTPNAIVAAEANTRATADNTLQGNITSEANARASADALKADKSTVIISGDGLTGGGDLSVDRTLAVGTTNDSISVAADGIKVDTVNALNSTSTTKPLSANQGRVLEMGKVDKVTGKSLIADTEIIRLAGVTNQTLSGLGGAPSANPTFTGNVVIPDGDAANEAVSKGQMDAADGLKADKSDIVNDLVTGGATKIASAETVKTLDTAKEAIKENVDSINVDKLGDVHAKSIDMDELPKVCDYPMYIISTTAPNESPDFISQHWIDTVEKKVYVAVGVSSAADFVVLN